MREIINAIFYVMRSGLAAYSRRLAAMEHGLSLVRGLARRLRLREDQLHSCHGRPRKHWTRKRLAFSNFDRLAFAGLYCIAPGIVNA